MFTPIIKLEGVSWILATDTRVVIGILAALAGAVLSLMLGVAIFEMRTGLWCGIRPYRCVTCCGLCPLRDRSVPAPQTIRQRLSATRHCAVPSEFASSGVGPRLAGSSRVLYDNPAFGNFGLLNNQIDVSVLSAANAKTEGVSTARKNGFLLH